MHSNSKKRRSFLALLLAADDVMCWSEGENEMVGAIAGDIIGSVFEHHQIKTKDFPLFHPRCKFTDDTVLTVAIADAVLQAGRT